MFGLTLEKLLLVGLLAAIILGPQRLPAVVARVAAVAKDVRRMVDAARVRAAAEIGVPADAPQWRALDPRQYDPRRIIAEALAAPSVPAGDRETAPDQDAVVPAPADALRDHASAPSPSSVEAGAPAAAAEARTTSAPGAPVAGPRMRRVRLGTSAHPRWISVPVDDDPSDDDCSDGRAEEASGAPEPRGATDGDTVGAGPRAATLLY